MKAFIIVTIIFFLLDAGGCIARKPNEPRPGHPAGVLLLAACIGVSMAVWGFKILTELP